MILRIAGLFLIFIVLSLIFILVQKADAFSFSYFAMNRMPIPKDVLMVLLAAGIIGIIGMTRRKLRK